MTLGEAKARVLKLLDETKPKADLTGKLWQFFDVAQRETAAVCPIKKSATLTSVAGEDITLPADFGKVRRVWYIDTDRGKIAISGWSVDGDKLQVTYAGSYELEYNAKPAYITANTADSYAFEVEQAAQDAMIFYVAAQCHATEFDQRFFSSFYSQYQGGLANLAAREPPVATVIGGWF